MPRIQQSIEIRVPVHIAYNQLVQFEDYPRFMQDVEAVLQLDESNLHWTTIMSNRPVEWDATITEQVPDQCIAWHNTSGAMNSGRIEVQALGPDAARVTLMLESKPEQVPGSPAGNSEAEMSHRLWQDLTRLKEFVENSGKETGAWRDEADDGKGGAVRERDARAQTTGDSIGKTIGQTAAEQEEAAQSASPVQDSQDASRPAPVPSSSFAAGSEGWDGTEDPAEPVVSAARNAAVEADSRPAERATQSDSTLSQSADEKDEDGRFRVAEEVSLDEQSDEARRVGQMPQDPSAAAPGAVDPVKAMKETMKQDAKDKADLNASIERAVPPSE